MDARSTLMGFIIDCNTDELETAAEFWSAALNMPRKGPSSDGKYVELDSGTLGLHIEVQKVSHPSRVHLDLRARDVDAEVKRLEALGAKFVERYERWTVMEAPTGQRFCVVRERPQD